MIEEPLRRVRAGISEENAALRYHAKICRVNALDFGWGHSYLESANFN